MICFLVSRGYAFTLAPLQRDANAPEVTILTYDSALNETRLPKATYVFVDLDRLSSPDLVAAGHLFRRLASRGCRVLNDPTRVLTRLPLLQCLHRNGINAFNVYSLDEADASKQFPVFIRIADDHKGPLTDLILDQDTLECAIEALTEIGYPRSELMIVEYSAEPVRPGIFRKLSVFRVAERYLPHVCVHDVSWNIKAGRSGVAPPELYDEELEILQKNPYAERMKKVFEIARIDFGRVDFSFVNGRPCIYEINTNPTIASPSPHSFPQRVASMKVWWEGLLSALHAIDQLDEPGTQVDVSVDEPTTLRNALDIYPGVKDGFLQLGKTLSNKGDKKAAIQSAQCALAQAPDDLKVILSVCKLMAQNDCVEDAIDIASRGLELDPSNLELLRQKAMLLRQKAMLLGRAKRLPEALEAAQRAVSLGPEDVRNYRALIEVQRLLGNLAAALEATSAAAKLISGKNGPGAAKQLRELRSQRRSLRGAMMRQRVRAVLSHIRPGR